MSYDMKCDAMSYDMKCDGIECKGKERHGM